MLAKLAAVLDVRTISRDALLNVAAASPLIPMRLRLRLLRAGGVRIGHAAVISPRCFFGTHVSVGDGTFVNYECLIEGGAEAPVSIGARCNLAMRVTIASSTHELGDRARRAGAHRFAPVVIGDGCWLGAGATVLPGVSIGEGCVVAAGAVVTEDCAPDGLYGGIPARRLRELT